MIWKTSQNSQVVFCQNMFSKNLQISQINISAPVSFWIKLHDGNLKLSEAATEMFCKKSCFWKDALVFQNQPFIDPLQNRCCRINLCWSLSLITLQFWGPSTLLKKTPTDMISCEICELFQNNDFEEHLWMFASKLYLKRDSNISVFPWILWII